MTRLAGKSFRLFNAEVRFASLAVAVVGFLLLLFPWWLDGRDDEVRIALASTLFTIGVIGVLYDAYLRRSFTEDALEHTEHFLRGAFADELFDGLGIGRELVESGVKEIDVGTRPQWDHVFRDATRVQCLVIEPSAWMVDQWPALLNAARSSPISISIYVPDHSPGTELEAIAERFDLSVAALGENAQDLRRRVEREWGAARISLPPLNPGTEVRVKRYRGVPSFSATLADRRGVLTIPGPFGSAQGEATLGLTFDAVSDTALLLWVREQLDPLESFGDIFYAPGAV